MAKQAGAIANIQITVAALMATIAPNADLSSLTDEDRNAVAVVNKVWFVKLKMAQVLADIDTNTVAYDPAAHTPKAAAAKDGEEKPTPMEIELESFDEEDEAEGDAPTVEDGR